MKDSLKTGFSFGLASGISTTLINGRFILRHTFKKCCYRGWEFSAITSLKSKNLGKP
jgi:hypothetical protein